MEVVVNILKVLGEMIRLFAERIGLDEKWEAVAAWLKAEKSHRQIVLVVGLLTVSLIVLCVYACSQRPDL